MCSARSYKAVFRSSARLGSSANQKVLEVGEAANDKPDGRIKNLKSSYTFMTLLN